MSYVQILVIPCGRCNFPIAECQHSQKIQTEQSFSGRKIDLVCPRCEWKGVVFGSQKIGFQEVEWPLEIHYGLHIDK